MREEIHKNLQYLDNEKSILGEIKSISRNLLRTFLKKYKFRKLRFWFSSYLCGFYSRYNTQHVFSSRPKLFCKKGVFRNFLKFT